MERFVIIVSGWRLLNSNFNTDYISYWRWSYFILLNLISQSLKFFYTQGRFFRKTYNLPSPTLFRKKNWELMEWRYDPAGLHLFKVNNGNTITTKVTLKKPERRTLFWCLYCKLWTDFTHCCDTSIFDLQENASWEINEQDDII